MMTKKYTRKIKPITQKDLDRFWGHVDIQGEDDCWNWKLTPSDHGYGLFAAGGLILHTYTVTAYTQKRLLVK